MIKYLQRLLLIYILLQLLVSCAIQSGGPEGGPTDVAAPAIVNESPANLATGFDREEIILSFDEFVQLNNPQQEIIITPAPEIPPTYIAKKRSIHVDLSKVSLQPNTTYSIQFGNAIVDINERNASRNYQYIFSTGDYIDSLTLAGRVGDALTLQPAKRVKVILHKPGNDSAIIKNKPQYYAYTDDGGSFSINYLPPDTYRVFALDDKNGNYTLDEGESVGFLDTALILDHNVGLADPILISPARLRPLSVTGYRISSHNIALGFNYPLDSFAFHEKLTGYFSFDDQRDSLNFWPSTPLTEYDSLGIIAYSFSQREDTMLQKRNKDTIPLQRLQFAFDGGHTVYNNYGTPLVFTTNQPIESIIQDSITLFQDSTTIKLEGFRYLNEAQTMIALIGTYEPDINYRIVMRPNALTSIYGESNNDTLTAGFSRPKAEDFAYLNVAFQLPDTGTYLFQLIKGEAEVSYEKRLTQSGIVNIPYVSPGTYKMRLIHDKNGNGLWDAGHVLLGIQPEVVYYYSDQITVKANWELLDLKFAPELVTY